MSYAARKPNSTPSKARCLFVTLGRSNGLHTQTHNWNTIEIQVNVKTWRSIGWTSYKKNQIYFFRHKTNIRSYYSWLTSFTWRL